MSLKFSRYQDVLKDILNIYFGAFSDIFYTGIVLRIRGMANALNPP